ncbi:septum formation family protein [Microbacterium sp. NPDC091382]|uniref:septum formation family protein n=1 Tax=Microbacterium sp. NPDC091382 TaxID=3364210 RepID=UPI00382EAC8D
MSTRHLRRCAVAAAVVGAVALMPMLSGCTQVASAVAGAIFEVRGEQPVPQPPAEAEDVDNDMLFVHLGVGDCFDDPNAYDGSDPEGAWSILLIPCEEAHWFEMYAKDDLGMSYFPDAMSPTAEFPGDDDVEDAANEVCYGAFADYVGESYEDSVLEYWYYVPTAESWAQGDRIARCVVGHEDGTVVGSAAGSGQSTS